MTLTTPPAGLVPEDYERIEAAVMETARGRWFLMEFARRQHAAETAQLLEAIARLERSLADAASARQMEPASAASATDASAPEPAGMTPPLPAAQEAQPRPDPRLIALSRLDRLSLESKIALFG